jgi:hypothetical protein
MAGMKVFVLDRDEDTTGISGTGIVAEGVQFADGRIVMRWLTNHAHSIVIHNSLDELLAIHGHEGRTKLRWLNLEEKELKR